MYTICHLTWLSFHFSPPVLSVSVLLFLARIEAFHDTFRVHLGRVNSDQSVRRECVSIYRRLRRLFANGTRSSRGFFVSEWPVVTLEKGKRAFEQGANWLQTGRKDYGERKELRLKKEGKTKEMEKKAWLGFLFIWIRCCWCTKRDTSGIISTVWIILITDKIAILLRRLRISPGIPQQSSCRPVCVRQTAVCRVKSELSHCPLVCQGMSVQGLKLKKQCSFINLVVQLVPWFVHFWAVHMPWLIFSFLQLIR